MIHIHDLDGCAPAPLAHYLKALGILRLVAEDKEHGDPEARGWWEGDRFRLASKLSREELEAFFLEWYQPTPLVAPWNGGTGFYPKDKKAKRAIDGLTNHPSQQFSAYRSAIADAQTMVAGRKEAPEKKDKNEFLAFCLRNWRGSHRDAMAAAVVLSQDGKPGYPSLLGTGFNDGRLDFTSNFMERLLSLFPANDQPLSTRDLLGESFWRNPARGMDGKGAVGQFSPGGAGGANCTAGPNGDPFSNPWDFVLMLEGTVLFVAHATRRMGANAATRAAAPFAVGAQGAGYASASDSDEGQRGEQWMPLWSQPTTLVEFKRLLAEGRAQIGSKPVREPLDLARSVMRLGTARGITEFQRYGYVERNGQANLAVPLGRFRVPDRSLPMTACLDDLETWLARLRQVARPVREEEQRRVPVRLRLAERRLSDALFAVVQDPEQPARWQAVLLGLAAVEGIMVSGSGYKAGPVPRLRPEWVVAATDGSPEFRLALALALQARAFSRDTRQPIGAVRHHWLPLEKGRFATTGTGSQTRLHAGPEVVMHGRRGIDDAIALVERRLIEAAQRGERRLPLVAAQRAHAHPADLAALLAGEIDLDRTLALARALMALDGHAWTEHPLPPDPPADQRQADDAWLVLRLALLPWPLKDGQRIGTDPAIFRRLASGDVATAVELALRRLRAAGICSAVRTATASPETARLWAAALAFPICRNTAEQFLVRLDPSFIQEKTP